MMLKLIDMNVVVVVVVVVVDVRVVVASAGGSHLGVGGETTQREAPVDKTPAQRPVLPSTSPDVDTSQQGQSSCWSCDS